MGETTAIIILNYNNYEDTINCVESVEKFNSAPVKFIVVDNGSTRDGAAERLGEYLGQRYGNGMLLLGDRELDEVENSKITLPYVTYIKSSSNDGYACGNNKALRLTECDDELEYVMILNNDVLFIQDIIPRLQRRYVSLADAAIISPVLYKRDMDGLDRNCARLNTSLKAELTGFFFHYWFALLHRENPCMELRYLIKDESNLPEIMKIELPSGSCMFIRKALFASVGFFDPNTFLYFEENILHRKMERIGLCSYLVGSLKCIHLGAQSTSGMLSLANLQCGMKSGRYYMKNYGGLTRIQYWLFLIGQGFFIASFRMQKYVCKLINKIHGA